MRRALAYIMFVSVLSMIPMSGALPAEPKEAGPDGLDITGSIFLSALNIPWKFISCVSTVVVTAPAYVLTAGVPGNFEEETHEADIGGIATSICSGPWVIPPKRVAEDYREDDSSE